jgi:hypothetical protein
VIACERSPGAISPVHARRQPDDQQARTTRPERRHRARMVIGILFLNARDMPPKLPEARPSCKARLADFWEQDTYRPPGFSKEDS